MEVNMNIGSTQITQNIVAQTEMIKPQAMPKDGSVIKGQITDIRGNDLTIKLQDGSDITGKTGDTTGLRIGDSQNFKVSVSDNQILLTSLNRSSEELNTKILSDILRSNGLKPSPENMKMLEFLLENQIPVTDDNLKFINQAFKLLGADTSKIKFFLENQIKLNTKNADLLQNFAEHKTAISAQLESLFDSLLEINNETLKNQIAADLLSNKSGGIYNILNGTSELSLNSEILTNAEALNFTTEDLLNADILNLNAANQDKTEIEESLLNQGKTENEAALLNRALNILSEAAGSGLPQNAENAIFARVNKNEINALKELLIKAFPQHEMQITNMAEEALERLTQLTDKITELAENQTLNFKTLEALVRESGISNLKLQEFDKTEAFKLINDLFPGESNLVIREKILNAAELNDNTFIKEALLKKFSINPEGLTKDEFNAVLRELTENLNNISRKFGESQQFLKITSEIQEIRDGLSFLSHLKNNVFIQIPLMINENQSTGELYVFKDKKKKNKNTSEVSALIALDTVNLGRFETYIVKHGNHVNFQFRLDNDKCESLVKENIYKLNDAMNAHSLFISGVSYKKITESFSLLNKEPVEDTDDEKPLELSKIIFDKRL